MASRINWKQYEEQIRELRKSHSVCRVAEILGINRSTLEYHIKTGMWSGARQNATTAKPYEETTITEDIYAWRFGFELNQESWEAKPLLMAGTLHRHTGSRAEY